jgi:hypothetical protein
MGCIHNAKIIHNGSEAMTELFENNHSSVPSTIEGQCAGDWSNSLYQEHFTYIHNSNSALLLADQESWTYAVSHLVIVNHRDN